MSSKVLLLYSLLLAGHLAAPTVSQTADEQERCGLYLAPSSKPLADDDQPERWGMYAGRDFKAQDMIGFPDVAINVHSFRDHNTEDGDEDDDEREFLSLLAQTVVGSLWQPDIAGADGELEEGESALLVPGAGLLSDYDNKVYNADFDARASYQRITVGDEPGQAHPGRGASSPFYNVMLRATDDILVGGEILLNFHADSTDKQGKQRELIVDDDGNILSDHVLAEEDYARIDQTVDQMLEFFKKHHDTIDDAGKLQIYRFMTNDFMEAAVGSSKAKKVKDILPVLPNGLEDVKQAGGIKRYDAMTKRGPRSKSIEWLELNGLCMDNIRPGPSTIPNAGRGAFASRKIQKGGIVAPSPLFLVPDKVSMQMFNLVEDEDGTVHRDDEIVRGHQLLYNYMYAHPKSTIGFIPAGAYVNLINHSSNPNSKIQWSKHYMHAQEYFQVSPVELINYESIGVVMEIVALRDIEEGEEITIDYGKEWQNAWEKHVASFEKKIASDQIASEWPLRATDLNGLFQSKLIRTQEELKSNPYPVGIRVKVFAMTDEEEADEDDDEEDDGDGSEEDPFIFTEPVDRTLYTGTFLVEPIVLLRWVSEEGSEKFLYLIKYPDEAGKGFLYMTGVPQHAFVFVDEPNTGDHFVPEPFRHYIEIPDDVFPTGPWRNLA